MNIVLHYSNFPAFTSDKHKKEGIGGTENFACNVASVLGKFGHDVRFYNMTNEEVELDNVKWANVSKFNPAEVVDLLISFRMKEVFQNELAAKIKVLILADTESVGLGDLVRAGKIDFVMAVSKWQMEKIAKEEGLVNHPCWILGSNGVNKYEFGNFSTEGKKTGMCIHLSTPERGLWQVLKVWPHVERRIELDLKGIIPELHLFSSFLGWGVSVEDNEKMAEGLYKEVERLQAQGYHVFNHKHVNMWELRKYQLEADLFLYPTNFKETYCMSLQECMYAGTIPIVSNIGAMPERVNFIDLVCGKYEEDSTTEEYIKKFADAVVSQLILPQSIRNEYRIKAHEIASEHEYDKLVPNWLELFKSKS